MPFRAYRRVKIVPGVRMNLSRSGPSLTFGGRGFHYTVGHGRRRTSIGLPGTGLSYYTYSHPHARHATATRAHPRAVAGTPAAVTSPRSSAPLLPGQKIVVGVVLTVLVVTAPIGIPLIVVGLVQRRQPLWQIRGLVHRSSRARDGDEQKKLLDQAYVLDPTSPEVLAPLAEWHYDRGLWPQASDLYRQYVATAPADWLARGHYAKACLEGGTFDLAIDEFTQVRAHAPLSDESRASVTANLADALIHKGGLAQALDLVRSEPLQRHTLGLGLQQCLYLRGVLHYLLGQRSQGIGDLDRLVAQNPEFPHLAATRAAMQAGTFTADQLGRAV